MVNLFAEIGYSSYRLIPGLNHLVPFDPSEPADEYLLNLFCCKRDRAFELADRGLLIPAEEMPLTTDHERLLRLANPTGYHGWENFLGKLPYGRCMLDLWKQGNQLPSTARVQQALALHAIAHDGALSAKDRHGALTLAFKTLFDVCGSTATLPRLVSLARVARELGLRQTAVQALNLFANHVTPDMPLDLTEPFLAVNDYFDGVDPDDRIGNWFVGSGLEELVRVATFSSFFTCGPEALLRLETIKRLGFASPELDRRWRLMRERNSLAT